VCSSDLFFYSFFFVIISNVSFSIIDILKKAQIAQETPQHSQNAGRNH